MRISWRIALLALVGSLHIHTAGATGPSKVVALEYCAPQLWQDCADAVVAWSSVLVLTDPGRVRVRVEYAEGEKNRVEVDPYRFTITVGDDSVATEHIMRSVALALGFGSAAAPFDWIDREFPGAGVYITDHAYSAQLTGRIMSQKLEAGAVLSASTVEAVRRAQHAESTTCIDAGDCRPGFECTPRDAALPDECRRRTRGISVAVIALIAVWSGVAALIVAL